jgi:glucose 1-dehydrogenase
MTTQPLPLAGKVALVTGAGGGIGRAAAVALAQAGADVAVNDLVVPEAGGVVAEVRSTGRRALPFPVDVTDQAAVEAMVARTAAELGRLDVLVLCAVYSDREPFTTADMAGFRRTIDVCMWGSYYCLRAAANQMIRQGQGGSVVVVSSPHSVIAFPNCMAYNMAKAAADQMARTAAMELLKHRIRVNSLHPGWTDTPGERKYYTDEDLRQAAPTLPAGRMARPEEIARGILFLADPASEYVNGTVLSMDGGLMLPWWSKRSEGGL